MKDKGPRIKKIPEGDTRERLVCPDCDYIAYENPKIVNVVVATYGDEFLLCRRNIEPGKGLWTLPGGYMENGETPQEGAAREAWEEAGATTKIGSLIAIFQPPSKNEVIMIFRGEMPKREADPGIESQEVEFFKWEEIPWKDLAFPFVGEALHAYKKTKDLNNFQPEIIVVDPPKPDASRVVKFRPPKPPGF